MATLYKFKSLRAFEHLADIFQNERFYAAQFFELNDPMEGRFDHFGAKQEFLREIRQGKEKLRICSFSSDFENLLLWAHYADSFRGVCIEVEVEDSPKFEVVKVTYSPFSVIVSTDSNENIPSLAKQILGTKNDAWEYEQEVRILSNEKYVSAGIGIRAVHLGVRTPEIMKETIRALLPRTIPVFETEISPSTNRVQKALPYKKRRRVPPNS